MGLLKIRVLNHKSVNKTQELLTKLSIIENHLTNIKENAPGVVSVLEGKTLAIKDALEDISRNAKKYSYEQELEKLDKDIDNLETELKDTLSRYHIFAYCEYVNWVGKIKDSGLNTKATAKVNYQEQLPLEQRIEAITQILEAGRALTKELIVVSSPKGPCRSSQE